MEVKTVGVVGAGPMGRGIAQLAAQARFFVVLHDVAPQALKEAHEAISDSVTDLHKEGRLGDETPATVLARLRFTLAFDQLGESDAILEAVSERDEVKGDVFRRLDRLCRPDVTFATATSSIPLTKLAATTARPERCVGMHFMDPPVIQLLVEIVTSPDTSRETYVAARALAERMGKVTVHTRDSAGFIVNRLTLCMINEAAYALYEDVGSAEDIDTAARVGMYQAMGPLALADVLGLDKCLALLEHLHSGLGDARHQPCPLIRHYVEAGWLGRKVGRGFYSYDAEPPLSPPSHNTARQSRGTDSRLSGTASRTRTARGRLFGKERS